MKTYISLFILVFLLSNSLASQAVSNKGFRSDMTFMDFDDITNFFHKGHKNVVHIIKHADAPVSIVSAEVVDKGTLYFESLKGSQNTYEVKVHNDSGKDILAYQVHWILKHPFENYISHRIVANSIKSLKSGATQTFRFKRNKHFRDDAYYYVEISKVEFLDDENIWEAPDVEEYKRVGPMDKVKEEIDAMEDSNDLSNPDSINLDELKKNLEKLESESLETDDSGVKNKVELEEIKKEDLAPKEDPVPAINKVIETIDTIYTDDSAKNLEKLELKPLQIDGSDVKNKIQDTVEEVKTTTTTTTETVIKKEEVKESEIVKEATPVKEADVIKETEVMKETQVLNKNQSNEEEEDFDFEDEEFDFDEDEEFEFDEDAEEEF